MVIRKKIVGRFRRKTVCNTCFLTGEWQEPTCRPLILGDLGNSGIVKLKLGRSKRTDVFSSSSRLFILMDCPMWRYWRYSDSQGTVGEVEIEEQSPS